MVTISPASGSAFGVEFRHPADRERHVSPRWRISQRSRRIRQGKRRL